MYHIYRLRGGKRARTYIICIDFKRNQLFLLSFSSLYPSFIPICPLRPFLTTLYMRRLSALPFRCHHTVGIIHREIYRRREEREKEEKRRERRRGAHINPKSICSSHKNDIVDLAGPQFYFHT